MSYQPYTPYTEVNQILGMLCENTKKILKEQFIGMYLYGSLATGDFTLQSSDIDFLVVTDDFLPEEVIAQLKSMHERLWASGLKWAAKLEGAYLPKDIIRCYKPDTPICPTVNEGQFYLAGQGSDWVIQRHVIREYGAHLEGPDPKTLIEPISPDQIRQAVLGTLREWWFPLLSNPIWLSERGGEYHAYAVLSMCRALHALQHGTIVSKPVAANWAGGKFPERQPIIKKALISQHTPQNGFLSEALEFIHFARNQATQGFTT